MYYGELTKKQFLHSNILVQQLCEKNYGTHFGMQHYRIDLSHKGIFDLQHISILIIITVIIIIIIVQNY